MDVTDLLEIERARNRQREREEHRDARFMAFLVTLWTGKPCKPEDLLGKPDEGELTEEQKARRAQILAAYHANGRRPK